MLQACAWGSNCGSSASRRILPGGHHLHLSAATAARSSRAAELSSLCARRPPGTPPGLDPPNAGSQHAAPSSSRPAARLAAWAARNRACGAQMGKRLKGCHACCHRAAVLSATCTTARTCAGPSEPGPSTAWYIAAHCESGAGSQVKTACSCHHTLPHSARHLAGAGPAHLLAGAASAAAAGRGRRRVPLQGRQASLDAHAWQHALNRRRRRPSSAA